MRSSLPDTASIGALQLLDEIGGLYDRAFGALNEGELDRALELVAQAEDRIGLLPNPSADDDATAARRAEVRSSHHRLIASATTARSAVSTELEKVRKGKQSISAYGGRSDPSGRRVDRDA